MPPQQKETEVIQQPVTLPPASACVTCHQRPRDVIFLPCGHQITCAACADFMEKCAVCGKTILGTVDGRCLGN